MENGKFNMRLQDEHNEELALNMQQLTDDYLSIPKGLKHLFQGYLDYAEMVVLDRAVPALDGLRVSQRRSLWVIYDQYVSKKHKKTIKSSSLSGKINELHPHNAKVIYETFANFVKAREYCLIPLLDGEGNFGHRNVADSVSADRYTSVKPLEAINMFFGEIQGGIPFIYTEDGEYTEPSILPVAFPFGLTMSLAGVGVGTGSNYFSFNVKDIADTIEDIILTGNTERVLVPDFANGGRIFNSPKAFQKIMTTGKGTINVSSSYHVEGNEIHLYNFHYFVEVGKLKKAIEDLEIEEVVLVRDATEEENLLVIELSSPAYADYVLKRVIRDTDLVTTASCNMITLINGQPKLVGVWEYLQEWINWRADIIRKYYSNVLEIIKYNIAKTKILIEFTAQPELVKSFVDTMLKDKHEAKALLFAKLTGLTDDIYSAISGMRISSLSDKSGRKKQLERLENELHETQRIIDNPLPLIRKEVKQIASKHGSERKTEIFEGGLDTFKFGGETTIDKEEVVEVHVTVKDGFLRKFHSVNEIPKEEEAYAVKAMSNEYVSCIDGAGRLIRIPLESIGFVNPYGATRGKNKVDTSYKGEYIPAYAGINSSEAAPIMYYDIMRKGIERVLLYSDGYVSSLKYDEWLDAKYITKMNHEGVSPLAILIMNDVDTAKEFTLVYTSLGRVAVFDNDYKRGSRTARRKVVSLHRDKEEYITHSISLNADEIANIMYGKTSMDVADMANGKPYNSNGLVDFDKFNALFI